MEGELKTGWVRSGEAKHWREGRVRARRVGEGKGGGLHSVGKVVVQKDSGVDRAVSHASSITSHTARSTYISDEGPRCSNFGSIESILPSDSPIITSVKSVGGASRRKAQ